MAFAQGLVDAVTDRRKRLEEAFDNDCDFFELFAAVNEFVDKQQGLLLGMSHHFGKKTSVNTPVLNDMIAIWFEMKQWKREIEDKMTKKLA